MNIKSFCVILSILAGAAPLGNATLVGFGQLGGSNATVPSGLASHATLNGNGFVVTNGSTPNIGLLWDANWDIHTSNFFVPLENQTVGGGIWDNEGNIPRIGQLDIGNHTLGFSADPGYALVLNSFDFGHTAESAGTTAWNLSLTDSSLGVVWQTTIQFNNGQTFTVSPNFTGIEGESYLLHFDRIAQSYNSDGRHGIDNLSFNQVVVPEPTTALFGAALLGVAGLSRRGRSKS